MTFLESCSNQKRYRQRNTIIYHTAGTELLRVCIFYPIKTFSFVISAREAAPHMVMVDFSSPVILSI